MKSKKSLDPQLCLTHPDSIVLSKQLAVLREGERLTFFNASGPLYVCRTDDDMGLRVAGAVLGSSGLNLASPSQLARVLGVNRNTVMVWQKAYREGGIDGLEVKKRRPRRPHKLKDERLTEAQQVLDEGLGQREAARRVGVDEGTIRLAVQKGRLHLPGAEKTTAQRREDEAISPRARSDEDSAAAGGVGVKRHLDRFLARMGKLKEAAPEFRRAEAVAKAGVLIALPAVLEQGVVDVAEQVYGGLKDGFFGLRSMVLSFVFMALLRIKTIEGLSTHAPGEFGAALGLDRAPEMKTVRRKLREIAERQQAWQFAAELARRWATEEPETLGFLYVDGHVRPYNGRKHTLPKTHVQRRRLCMPATTDYWVNDAEAEPVFFVTAPANDGLLSMLDEQVVPRARSLVGQGRRFTLVFDREGWSPKTFKRWSEQDGIDILTYRKGKYAAWDVRDFHEVEVEVSGGAVMYKLAERMAPVGKGFRVREVRRLCEDGHQTAVVTTRRDLSIGEVAVRMFSRWRQENFFRYMRHEFSLDHLPTTAVEPADPTRTVPNPALKAKRKELKTARDALAKLEAQYGGEALSNPEGKRRTMRGFKIAQAALGRRIEESRERCAHLKTELAAMPKRVAVGEVMGLDRVVRLEQERKVLTDLFKVVAYRAETAMANLIAPLLSGRDDEARKFLKEVFNSPADLLPDLDRGNLVVRFYSLDTPRANQVLADLCEVLNQFPVIFPGTHLTLVYEAPSAT